MIFLLILIIFPCLVFFIAAPVIVGSRADRELERIRELGYISEINDNDNGNEQ